MAALPEPSLPFKWSLDSAIGDPCHPRVVQSAESSDHPVRSWWSRRRRWRRGDDGDDGEVVFLGESVWIYIYIYIVSSWDPLGTWGGLSQSPRSVINLKTRFDIHPWYTKTCKDRSVPQIPSFESFATCDLLFLKSCNSPDRDFDPIKSGSRNSACSSLWVKARAPKKAHATDATMASSTFDPQPYCIPGEITVHEVAGLGSEVVWNFDGVGQSMVCAALDTWFGEDCPAPKTSGTTISVLFGMVGATSRVSTQPWKPEAFRIKMKWHTFWKSGLPSGNETWQSKIPHL